MTLCTIVLLGDVGVGKSSLVEKITGLTGLSSQAARSFTRSSNLFVNQKKCLRIIDTPGGNSMADKLEHNVWIAHALNYSPVSLILLMVKADMRIDSVVNSIRDYAERFQDLSNILGVCVTHMDTVTWSHEDFHRCLQGELGIESALLVGKRTCGTLLLEALLKMCKAPEDLRIDSSNFLKFFKINSNSLKILKTVRDEVAMFQTMHRNFVEYLHIQRNAQDRVDLVFEYQAYMTDQICKSQARVSKANVFTFSGPNAASEIGHLANLSNQLRSVLLDVRTLALGYQNNAGVSDLRKCPHCGTIWAKIEGCDGETVCGNLMKRFDGRYDTLANFSFKFDGGKLKIDKVGLRPVSAGSSSRASRGAGCGANITWKSMAPVPVPADFTCAQTACTDDVQMLPAEIQSTWDEIYSKTEASLGELQTMTI